MTHETDLNALRDELAALRRRVEAQDAELAKLRRPAPAADGRIGRRHLLGALAGLGAAGATGLATAQPSAAADGDSLLLGQANTATEETTLTTTTTGIGLSVISSGGFAALSGGGGDNPPKWGVAAYGQEAGLWAESAEGFGVHGQTSSDLPAVTGENLTGGAGLGGASAGGGPQLWLDSADEDPAGPPSSGLRGRGQIKADVNGDLWMCVATGTPGTWTRLLREDTSHGRVIPIPPVRVLDTRVPGGRPEGSPVVPGQVGGVIHGKELVTLDLAGHAGIPATATGVIGHVVVVRPTGDGRLQIRPAGTTTNTTELYFLYLRNGSDAFTCGLAPAGITISSTIPSRQVYHLLVDVNAYIT